MDAVPPASATPAAPPAPLSRAGPTDARAGSAYAPTDIYPRGPRERELCSVAARPDWLYLGGLVVLDAGAIWFGSTDAVKNSPSLALRMSAPVAIGVTWGATVGGAWIALPQCDATWVGEPPREGAVRATWPVALSLALLAGATAPIINGIAVGDLPIAWSDFEREMHLVAAGVAGFGGALLPYLLPPRSWAAAREIDRLRFGSDGRGAYIGYATAF